MIYNSKQIHNDFYFKNSNEREGTKAKLSSYQLKYRHKDPGLNGRV